MTQAELADFWKAVEGKPLCKEHNYPLDEDGYCPACEDPYEFFGKDED